MQHGAEAACPLQRLLVLHLNLAKLCTGRDLGESASLEEWGEQILYYRQDGLATTATATRDAVQFAGLCSALYNLPSTLKNYQSNIQDDGIDGEDLTQEVQLDQSTLVFVPLLEDCADNNGECSNNIPSILCVAQVSRTPQEEVKAGGNSGAIRSSMERWHTLFCLLRGGGIHARLGSTGPGEQSPSSVATKKVEHVTRKCPYPGMDQLFEGFKTLRRLRETIYRSSEPDADLDLEHDNLKEELDIFRKTLPLASLREDLKFHYDAFIEDFALISSRQGGVGRCLVDSIPAPIALSDASHASNWIPESPPPHVSFHLGQAIRGLLSEAKTNNTDTDERHPPELLAIFTFYRGQLLYHHSSDGQFHENNTSASLLMWYLAAYSFKVHQQQQSQQTFAAATPPRRLSHGLVSFSDHMSVATDADSLDRTHPNDLEQDLGRLLGTPPLAMLSVSEQKTTQIMGPHGEAVWAPLVHYSPCCSREATQRREAEQAHVMLYEWNDFSFLLFVRPTDRIKLLAALDQSQSYDSKANEDGMSALLGSIIKTLADSLNVVVVQTVPLEKCTRQSKAASLTSPGRDIVFIDRKSSQSMIIPRSPRKPSSSDTYASPKRLMHSFWAGPSSSPKKDSQKMASGHDAEVWAMEGLDCRHWLVSQLSLRTVLAFDDAMNEVSRYRQQWREGCLNDGNDGILGGKYEVLTTVSEGWVYAFADREDRELYIYLDSKDYVTIADAEKAIKEVRAAVLHDFVL